MGWNSQPTSQVIFEDCKVPVENLIGNEGDGFKIAMMGLDGGRLNIAACSLGTAQSAYDRAIQYVGEREQFGKKIQEFQALQFKLADMATDLEASRLILRDVLRIKLLTKSSFSKGYDVQTDCQYPYY